MKRTWTALLTPLFIVLLAWVTTCGSVWAQATAQISGTVRDQSGAVLPGAEITVTQTETGVSRMSITNETGYYVMPNLPLGPYRLEAGLPGFRTFVQTGIVLQVGSNPTINVTLEVGQVSEQVEVQANAALVETRSLSVGQVMETARIMELPLNGRNAQELVLLQGGAAQVLPAGGMAYPTGRLMISSAGGLGTSMEYTLDGIRHIDAYDGEALPLPFPDALAEFKTEIGGMSAQQDRGSQVSAVTKSGTNAFHGDLFEFVRNDLFNARNYFATKGSTLKRNQFGGVIGGPIIKNKLFFFGGFQGTTIRQDPRDARSFVPTAAMLAGDFTAFTSPACNARGQITLRAPFVNNRIDPALFSSVARNLAGRLPKTDNPCGEVIYGQRNISDEWQYVGKIDHQTSAKHSLFGRFLISLFDDKSPLTDNNILTVSESTKAKSLSFTFGSTYLVSPSTVNAFRLAFSRTTQNRFPPQFFDASELGSKVHDYLPKVMAITVTGGFSMGGNYRRLGNNLYQFTDDVSMTRGKHQFNFGVRAGESRTHAATGDTILPNFQIGGDVTGAGLADFLLGRVSSFIQGLGAVNHHRNKFISVYGQNTWQMKPRLTVSYGLRWSPILPLVDVRRPIPIVPNFIMERYRQGLRSTVFVNAPPGFLYPGDPGFVQKNNGADAAKPRADVWKPYWNVFAPRLGFAWDIEGNGRTSIRASYGITYEEYPGLIRTGSSQQQPPWGSTSRLLAPAGGMDNPWLGIPGGNPHPLQLTKDMPFVPRGDYLPANPDLDPTYTQTWNLSIQREVVRDTLLSMSYIGSQITHLQAASPLNMGIFVPGVGDANGNCFLNGRITHFRVNPGSACSTVTNTQDRRALSFVNPAFKEEIGRLAILVNEGTQNYHGMLVSIQRRPSEGINLNANYTWSHCIGDFLGRSHTGYGRGVDQTYQDPNDRKRDRGNCEVDQRHAFNLTAVAETPQFASRTLRLAASGWRLSGIYRRSTAGNINTNTSSGIRTVTMGQASGGQRGNVAGGDRCLCDISGQRPNLVLPDAVYLDKSGRPNTQYLNPAAFAEPPLGTYGNLGRTTLRLPAAWQFDLSLSRVFRFRESQRLEFRAEAYNVTNSFRPGNINTDLTNANFGRIRTAQDPRIMQFALKYLF